MSKSLLGRLTIGEVSWSTVVPKLLRSVEVRQDRAQYTFGEVDYRQSGGIDYRHDTYSYRGDPVAAFLGGIQFSATNDNNVTDTLTLSQGVPSDFHVYKPVFCVIQVCYHDDQRAQTTRLKARSSLTGKQLALSPLKEWTKSSPPSCYVAMC